MWSTPYRKPRPSDSVLLGSVGSDHAKKPPACFLVASDESLSEGYGHYSTGVWKIAIRRPECRHNGNGLTWCGGVCPHTWPALPKPIPFSRFWLINYLLMKTIPESVHCVLISHFSSQNWWGRRFAAWRWWFKVNVNVPTKSELKEHQLVSKLPRKWSNSILVVHDWNSPIILLIYATIFYSCTWLQLFCHADHPFWSI